MIKLGVQVQERFHFSQIQATPLGIASPIRRDRVHDIFALIPQQTCQLYASHKTVYGKTGAYFALFSIKAAEKKEQCPVVK